MNRVALKNYKASFLNLAQDNKNRENKDKNETKQ